MAFDVNSKISLQELSSALEQELLNHDHDNAVYQLAIYSCRHELRYIKGVLETNAVERDKLMGVSGTRVPTFAFPTSGYP